MCAVQRIGGIVGCVPMLMAATQLTLAQNAGTGNCGPGTVPVKQVIPFSNTSGQPANDFHVYIYQNDKPRVEVLGAQVNITGAGTGGTASVTLGTDNGKEAAPDPPGSKHGAQVDLTGCDIPVDGTINVEITLCMNEENCLKTKDVEFTHDGDPLPPDPNRRGPRKGGWRAKRPYPGGGGGDPGNPGGGGHGAQGGGGGAGNWVHRVCWENDDATEWVVIDELKLLATILPTLPDDVDWDSIDPIDLPYPICVPPLGRYCYEFETIGPYLGSFVDQKWSVHVYITGECGGPPSPAGTQVKDSSGGTSQVRPSGASGNNEQTVYGQHPIEALLTDCLDGFDYYQTTTPTDVPFGTVEFPPIPADFFGPGSQPFFGTVSFVGQPLDSSHSNADTIVQRKADAYLDNNGDSAIVPIELVQLSLRSVEPIHVNYAGGKPDWFDVLAGTTAVGQPPTQTAISPDAGVPATAMLRQGLTTSSPPLASMVVSDGSPPGTSFADHFFDIFFASAPSFPGTAQFDVLFNVTPPSGVGFFPMPAPLLSFTPTSFSLTFGDILLGDGNTLRLQGGAQLSPTQPLQITGCTIQGYTGNSLFRVRVQMLCSGPVNVSQRIMSGNLGGRNPFVIDSFFDVFYSIDPLVPSAGTMNITRNSPSGGTFDSQLQVRPVFTFRPPGGTQSIGPYTGMSPQLNLQTSPHGWSYMEYPGAPMGSGPNFFPDPGFPLQWTNPSGAPHTVLSAIGIPHATAWHSMHVHTTSGPGVDIDLSIALDPSASGNGGSGPTSETRGGGLQRVRVDFDQPVFLTGSPVSLTGHLTFGGVMGPLQDFSPFITGVVMVDVNTIEIQLGGGLPNEGCYRFELSGAVMNTAFVPLGGDTDCYVRGLVGDVNDDGAVTLSDALDSKTAFLSGDYGDVSRPTNRKRDLNRNQKLNLSDALAAKARIGQMALCP